VNAYADEDPRAPERFDVPVGLAEGQVRALAELRAMRDGTAAEAALSALGDAARRPASTMPAILAAVRADATLGEICGVLRGVYGEYRPASAAQI
jgi:methylmalonyl-CoA mutase N-terminal domain/subunit